MLPPFFVSIVNIIITSVLFVFNLAQTISITDIGGITVGALFAAGAHLVGLWSRLRLWLPQAVEYAGVLQLGVSWLLLLLGFHGFLWFVAEDDVPLVHGVLVHVAGFKVHCRLDQALQTIQVTNFSVGQSRGKFVVGDGGHGSQLARLIFFSNDARVIVSTW